MDGRRFGPHQPWWEWVTLAIGLLISAAIGWQSWQQIEQTVAADLRFEGARIGSDIEQRLHNIAQVLRGAGALFATSKEVSRGQWRDYVAALQRERNVSGIPYIGFAKALTPNEIASYVAGVRQEGLAEYRMRPSGNRTASAPIHFVEPFSGFYAGAIGYDLFAQPQHRTAMEQARDTGLATLTCKVRLLPDEPQNDAQGVVMYLPVYRSQEPIDTVAGRQAALLGWVFSPHTMAELMEPLSAELTTGARATVELEIYDNTDKTAEDMLFDSAGPQTPLSLTRFFHTRTVTFNASQWLLEFDRNPKAPPVSYISAWLSFGGCCLISYLLFRWVAVARLSTMLSTTALADKAKLRQQNNDLSTILEHMPSGVTLFDANLRLVRHNQQFGAQMELLDSDLLQPGTAFDTLIAMQIDRGDAQAIAHANVLHKASDNSQSSYTLERLLPNGRSFDVYGRVLEDGGFVTFYSETTARKANELLLRKLSAAVDQTSDGIVITDLSGRIEYANNSFAQMSGYSQAELSGQNPSLLRSGKTPPETYRRMWSQLLQGFRWSGEFFNRNKDGLEYIVFARVTPIRDGNNNATHYVAISEDVTEKKRLGDELDLHRRQLEILVDTRTADLVKERDRAESAGKAKTEFLANMSHEIRTPIHAVMGYAGLCQNMELPARAQDYLKKIVQASESLMGTINDILDTSKLDAGMLTMEAIEFDIGEVLSRLGGLFQRKAIEKGLELVIGCEPNVPEWLVGDPHRLGQVLNNLLGNSLKFTHQGEVQVTVQLKERKADTATLHFQVQDTGVGMTAQQAQNLFKAFSQADTSITRQYGGTGLGLSISQQLVGMMKGRITVQSQAGGGSTFAFDATFGLDPDGHNQNATDSLMGKRVLVVEDNDAMRKLYALNLSSFGCVVRSEASAEAALAAIAVEAEFDLVILDLHLPAMSGLEAAHCIRTAGHHCHMILITGDNLDLADASIANGEIHAVLSKPTPRTLLQETIARLLGTAHPKPAAPVNMVAATPDFSGKRILLVDDIAYNQEIGVALIERTGATVEIAENGALAVEAITQASFDLVLMDIQMPIMDGYAAARIVHAQRPALPMVALTANAMVDERERVLDAGMNDLLTKPFVPSELYAVMAKWLAIETDLATLPRDIEIAQANPSLDTVFDHAAALLRVGGDQSLLQRFMSMYFTQTVSNVGLLESAMQECQTDVARRLAHTIKGGAGMLGMTQLQLASAQLETNLLHLSRGAECADISQENLIALKRAWERARETIGRMLEPAEGEREKQTEGAENT
jgi:PAS domain S-box-containing protein